MTYEITINALALAALVAFAALFLAVTPDSVNGDGEVADEGLGTRLRSAWLAQIASPADAAATTFIGHMSESEVAE